MSTKQGYIQDFEENKMIPETTSAMVTDLARNQALSASLMALVEKNSLGFPDFTTVEAHAVGDEVYYDRKLWKFTDALAQGAAWDATKVREFSLKEYTDTAIAALQTLLENGGIVPALASNLASWANRNAQSVESEMTAVVRSTAGDESIDSTGGATIKSIVAEEDASFGSAKFISSGYNLLRLRTNNGLAVPVGAGWYIPVPKLECSQATVGTSDANNGVLLTDSDGNSITNATVYFKPLSEGVPTSETDGTACSYVTVDGRRHYTCSEAGYLIISGITWAATCAHLAWSTDYDKYVSPTAATDAGTIVDLANLGDMLTLGSATTRWDRTASGTGTKTAEVGSSSNLSWTDTENEGGESYTHSATISGMEQGSTALIKLNGETSYRELSMNGNIVSFSDNNATVAAGYIVKYKLAVPATSTVQFTTDLTNINDWGIEALVGATGECAITMQYAQGIPDAIFSLLSRMKTVEEKIPVLETGVSIAMQSIEDYRLKPVTADNLAEGAMLFYDRKVSAYRICDKRYVSQFLADREVLIEYRNRYETNYDTYVGTTDGVAHFAANNDAAPSQSLYSNDVAATACYYRLEIEVGQVGEITFSANSGSASVAETTITWGADATLAEIVALFTAKNASRIVFAKLADDGGVGLKIDGYGANTLTVVGEPTNCTVIDCSKLAFLRTQNAAAPAVGGTFDPTASYTLLGADTHHNFCGAAAASVLGTAYPSLVGASTTLLAVNGLNYSYRCGGNFAKFLSWATNSGDNSFVSDGVNSSTANSSGKVMRRTAFDAAVNAEATADSNEAKMYEYYNHLLTDQSGDYATLRYTYESRYGQMHNLYEAYLMSHMIDIAANSGITNSMRNKGKAQTDAKADCMNVTYDYVIIPAYPPEYNAHTYGVTASEGFQPGVYYHPEPADLGLMFRDDNMALINANIDIAGAGTKLTNGMYRGSCADCNAYDSWYFDGDYGCIDNVNRYNSYFRSRPALALALPS